MLFRSQVEVETAPEESNAEQADKPAMDEVLDAEKIDEPLPDEDATGSDR